MMYRQFIFNYKINYYLLYYLNNLILHVIETTRKLFNVTYCVFFSITDH